ncbi:hypothetical protein [Aeromicrobium endophyticum]|uniref:Cache domain-containing protein n=1 Tax=Aeromicrobium endophyticum TaxID=2292704 RepID=A0A371P8K8_9ACTN|nr:hypothetical protein [Aeromicrobium endophyticum]REK72225.1 hypothetical protein DX116_00825 [Aeromicrobium endophyticum]
MTTPNQHDSLEAVARAVADLTQPVFARLEALAQEVSALDLRQAVGRGRLDDHDAAVVESLAVQTVQTLDLVSGAGMAATAGETSSDGVMHWWILRDGAVVTKRHVLNPASDSYYDFSNLRWFTLPASSGTNTLIAPYIDSWGTDDLTVTAAVLVPGSDSAREVTAVVAVDLNARAYVQAVEDVLRSAAPAVLIDGEGRAVCSTEPDIETGVRLAALPSWSAGETADVLGLGWTVASLDATTG